MDLTKESEATQEALRHGRAGNRGVRHATACWRAAWWSAACASSSCTAAPAAAGTRTRTSKATTRKWCRASDKPIAGLLTDLKARGLLDDTLVVWGGEFGRTPFNEKGDGRDHNPWGFTMWMAGGGVKGGQYIGTTDEIGLRAVERPLPRPRYPRVHPLAARASTT